jgi:ABC-type branched-subunit amino acid transport system substrate-binding protein
MPQNRSKLTSHGRTGRAAVVAATAGLAAVGVGAAAGASSPPPSEPAAGGAAMSTVAQADVITGNGVTDSEIDVAVLNGFTGPVANLAIPAADGMEAYFNMVNDAGGVCGRQIVLDRRDTQYDAQIAIQEYRAVRDDIAMLAGVVGSAAIFGLSEDIQRDHLALLANTGTEAVLPLPNVLMFIAPFALEVINGVSYAVDQYAGDDGVLQLGVVYQADAFGEAGMAAAQYVADHNDKVEIVGTATYTPTDQDLSAQAQAMADSGAEVVWTHVISAPPIRSGSRRTGWA